MSGHTPGPWACFYKHKYDEWHVSIPIADSTMKLALFDDGVRSENPEADARLIAAAPELLEALTAAASDIDCLLDFVGESSAINMIGGRSAYGAARDTLDKICAAIKKATEA